MRQLKLIWDFRGLDAVKIAEHHVVHLKEYILAENLEFNITGVDKINDLYAIAFLIVSENEMCKVRDSLKPHRGQVYTAN
jgi:hypothetical protein